MESKETLLKNAQTRIRQLVSAFPSQQEFADYCHVSKYSVSQYVSGTNAPGNVNAAKIAKCFSLNPLWVMGFDVPKERDEAAIRQKEMEESYMKRLDRQLDQENALQKYCELHGINFDYSKEDGLLHIIFPNGQDYRVDPMDWKVFNLRFPRIFEDLVSLFDKTPTLLMPLE